VTILIIESQAVKMNISTNLITSSYFLDIPLYFYIEVICDLHINSLVRYTLSNYLGHIWVTLLSQNFTARQACKF